MKTKEFARSVAALMKSNNHLPAETWFRVFVDYGLDVNVSTAKYHDAQCVLLGLLESLEEPYFNENSL